MNRKFGPVPAGLAHLIRTRKRRWVIAAALILALTGVVYATFIQSFETDSNGWFNATRVMSGTHLVPSIGAFHAEDDGGAFTRWGGYSKTFPPGGYITSIDIYLDIDPPYGQLMNLTPYPNDTRFDWTSAISEPNCDHRRDFVFNAGFYTDTDTTGSGPRFVISASNNAGRANSFPKNPGRDPFTINVEGWYRFEHRFYSLPSMTGLQLYVDLTIKTVGGVPLHTWTLTDPSDIIGTTVGGNRYGWFATDEFPFLAFDNSALIGFQDFCVTPPSTPGAKITGGGWIDVMGGKGTFGLTARAANSGANGNLTYQDHGLLERTVKSTSITSVTVNGNCAQILGMATVNGTGDYGFEVHVCDNGEPGTYDTFSIEMSDGYVAGVPDGTLRHGNIQIH
jgi:hypothetical protein